MNSETPSTSRSGVRTAYDSTSSGTATLPIQQTGTTAGGNAPPTLTSRTGCRRISSSCGSRRASRLGSLYAASTTRCGSIRRGLTIGHVARYVKGSMARMSYRVLRLGGTIAGESPSALSSIRRLKARISRCSSAVNSCAYRRVEWEDRPVADSQSRSEECLKSIYESITLVFTDLHSWQSFVGFCPQDARMRNWPKVVDLQPHAFPKYCKHLELSMTPFFPCLITCSSPVRTPQLDRPHDPYDFHWLRLDLFQNLQSIKIWVTARSTKVLKGPNGRGTYPDFVKITDLNIDELRKALSCFAGVSDFVISTPLSNDVGPEDGLVKGITVQKHHRVWKRGTGDIFHPRLSPNFGRGGLSGLIYTSVVRYESPESSWPLYFPNRHNAGIFRSLSAMSTFLSTISSRTGPSCLILWMTLLLGQP